MSEIIKSGLAQLLTGFGIDTEQITKDALKQLEPFNQSLVAINNKLDMIMQAQADFARAMAQQTGNDQHRFHAIEQQISVMSAAQIDLTDLPPQDAVEPNL